MSIDEVLVSALPGDRRAAARTHGRLIRLALDLPCDEPRAGELHLGRLVRLLPAMGGALVDIGADRPGVLMRNDAPSALRLAEGGVVGVRVVREPEAGKGARLDARLSPAEQASVDAAAGLRPPHKLAEAEDPVSALVRAVAGPALRRIVVDCAPTLIELRRVLPQVGPLLELWQGDGTLFTSEGVDDEIAAALTPVVPLPSGGRVTFEHTAAVTAVDVDLGGGSAAGSARTAALACDLEAAAEIGRQIVLRDIGGVIVVDFVPVRRPGDRRRIAETLVAALGADDRTLHVGGWTRLGLFELTRRRLGAPLGRKLSQACGACGGGGRVVAAAWIAGDALRALAAAGRTHAFLRLAVGTEVRAALGGPLAAARTAVETALGRPLELIDFDGDARGFQVEPVGAERLGSR